MTHPIEFEVLVEITGGPYERMRDDWLHSWSANQAQVAAHLEDPDWRASRQSAILNGWHENGDFYRGVLAELDAVDVEQEGKTAVGIARVWDAYAYKAEHEYGEKILPLAWEVAWKLSDDRPAWYVITFLKMIAAVPVAPSILPVLDLLETSRDGGIVTVAGQTLERLPSDPALEQLQAANARHERILEVIQDTIEGD